MTDFAANLAKGQTQQNAALAARNDFRKLLEKVSPRLQKSLPSFIPADRFIQTVLTMVNKNPKLLECTQASLFGALFQSATLGVLPDSVLGQAYLIPYNNKRKRIVECQFILGYKGLRELAFRTGQVKRFQSRSVYSNDSFRYAFGLDEVLEHTPSDGDRGELTHVYAVLEFTNGGRMFDVMKKEDVEKIRLGSPGKDSDPWRKYYSEMAEKTVLRKLSKAAPLSPEFNRAVELDEAADQGRSQDLWADLDVPEMAEVVQEAVVQEAEIVKKEDLKAFDDAKIEKHLKAQEKGEAATEAARNMMNLTDEEIEAAQNEVVAKTKIPKA